MRQRMFELLDAVAAEDWQTVHRLARGVEILGPPSQRDLYARQWIEKNKTRHPRAVEWVARKIREREAARDEATEPLIIHCTGQWPERLYRAMRLW